MGAPVVLPPFASYKLAQLSTLYQLERVGSEKRRFITGLNRHAVHFSSLFQTPVYAV